MAAAQLARRLRFFSMATSRLRLVQAGTEAGYSSSEAECSTPSAYSIHLQPSGATVVSDPRDDDGDPARYTQTQATSRRHSKE